MLFISDLYILYILGFIGSLLAFYKGNYPVALVLLFYSLSGIWIYLKIGTIHKAAEALRKGKSSKALFWIKMNKSVKTLFPKEKAYYHYIYGIILYEKNDFAAAYKHLIIALQSGQLAQQEQQLAQNIVESLQKSVM